MTANQKIERSRNRRLWIAQIIIPTVTAAVGIAVAFPTLGKTIGTKVGEWKANIRRKKFVVKKNQKYKIDYEKSMEAMLHMAEETNKTLEESKQQREREREELKKMEEQVRILQAQINIKETGEY